MDVLAVDSLIRLRRPRNDRFSGRFEADVFDSGVFLKVH